MQKLLFWLFGASEKAIDVTSEFLIKMGGLAAVEALDGKFVKVGTLFGRVFAIYFSTEEVPPEGHPKAVYLDKIDMVDDFALHVFGTSFSKKKWNALDPELKVKVF